MIENEFDAENITEVNFGVCLRSNGNLYFVPTDAETKSALKDICRDTIAAFQAIGGDWEPHDISEDYGAPRRVYADRQSEFMAVLSAAFDTGTFADLTNLSQHASDVDYYFAQFVDSQRRRAMCVKKATRLKGTMKARNRLVRLVDDTLVLIREDVLRLDAAFDLIVTDDHVFILNTANMEHITKIVARVAATAEVKVQTIHDSILFIDFERIKLSISSHPRVARQVASIASNPSINTFQRARIEALAEQHGIKFKELANGRLQCRKSDEAKLIELLDARRYHLDLTGNGGDPYRASARQKVST